MDDGGYGGRKESACPHVREACGSGRDENTVQAKMYSSESVKERLAAAASSESNQQAGAQVDLFEASVFRRVH